MLGGYVKHYLFVAVLFFVVGCGQTSTPVISPVQPPQTKLRPVGSPDVVLFGISGKCFTDDSKKIYPFNSCLNLIPALSTPNVSLQNSRNNFNYLGTRGTLQKVSQTIANENLLVNYYGFAASYPDRENSSSGTLETQYGFLTMMNTLTEINNKWIKGFDNPTKIVIVAHSHGTVWSHLLTKYRPDIEFFAQIDLDGVCMYWGSDNVGDFRTYGNPWSIETSGICGAQTVSQGGTPDDIQNLVYPNVKFNFEIQANAYSLISYAVYDKYDNKRVNGLTDGVKTFYSSSEDHGKVSEVGSIGLAKVEEWLREIF